MMPPCEIAAASPAHGSYPQPLLLQDGDEEANQEEEAEALRLQSLAAQRLRDEDFEIPELANEDAAEESDGEDGADEVSACLQCWPVRCLGTLTPNAALWQIEGPCACSAC